MPDPSVPPPLRVRQTGGANLIPVFELELSGGTLTKTGPASAKYTPPGTAAGAPADGEYVSYAANATLTGERILTAGSSVTIVTDASAIYINALTNAAVGGPVYAPTGGTYVAYVADGGLSAEKVLTAGSSVTIVTDATAIYINALTNAASGVVYAPSGGPYVAFATDGTLTNERLLTAGSSVTLVTDATAIYVTALTPNVSTFVANTRTLTTLFPLNGGGDLSADRTLSLTTAGFIVTSARTITASSGLSGSSNLGADVILSVNTNVRDKATAIFFSGALSTTSLAIHARLYIPNNMQLIAIRLAAQTAPTDAAIIINPLQYNAALSASTAIFASTNRPTIVASAKVGSDDTVFALPSLYAGSWLGINLDQVGSTVAGSNLSITVITRTS